MLRATATTRKVMVMSWDTLRTGLSSAPPWATFMNTRRWCPSGTSPLRTGPAGPGRGLEMMNRQPAVRIVVIAGAVVLLLALLMLAGVLLLGPLIQGGPHLG